jgi:hypothetical protein
LVNNPFVRVLLRSHEDKTAGRNGLSSYTPRNPTHALLEGMGTTCVIENWERLFNMKHSNVDADVLSVATTKYPLTMGAAQL